MRKLTYNQKAGNIWVKFYKDPFELKMQKFINDDLPMKTMQLMTFLPPFRQYKRSLNELMLVKEKAYEIIMLQ